MCTKPRNAGGSSNTSWRGPVRGRVQAIAASAATIARVRRGISRYYDTLLPPSAPSCESESGKRATQQLQQRGQGRRCWRLRAAPRRCLPGALSQLGHPPLDDRLEPRQRCSDLFWRGPRGTGPGRTRPPSQRPGQPAPFASTALARRRDIATRSRRLAQNDANWRSRYPSGTDPVPNWYLLARLCRGFDPIAPTTIWSDSSVSPRAWRDSNAHSIASQTPKTPGSGSQP
jgi:hypothetical protein